MDCILGIKCNGVLLRIDTLTIESDQTQYDYICNVMLANENNGNGTYDISIIDKQLLKGFPIGNWQITKASISFDWGDSYAKLTLTDDKGIETKEIIASQQAGSRSESRGFFDTNILARSIFSKAQKIVIEYPSAEIYNALMCLEDERRAYYWKNIKERYQESKTDIDRLIEFLDFAMSKIKDYLDKYNTAKMLLEESNDPRAKRLLSTITSNCKELLQQLEL